MDRKELYTLVENIVSDSLSALCERNDEMFVTDAAKKWNDITGGNEFDKFSPWNAQRGAQVAPIYNKLKQLNTLVANLEAKVKQVVALNNASSTANNTPLTEAVNEIAGAVGALGVLGGYALGALGARNKKRQWKQQADDFMTKERDDIMNQMWSLLQRLWAAKETLVNNGMNVRAALPKRINEGFLGRLGASMINSGNKKSVYDRLNFGETNIEKNLDAMIRAATAMIAACDKVLPKNDPRAAIRASQNNIRAANANRRNQRQQQTQPQQQPTQQPIPEAMTIREAVENYVCNYLNL